MVRKWMRKGQIRDIIIIPCIVTSAHVARLSNSSYTKCMKLCTKSPSNNFNERKFLQLIRSITTGHNVMRIFVRFRRILEIKQFSTRFSAITSNLSYQRKRTPLQGFND